jgi:hypothetical protein
MGGAAKHVLTSPTLCVTMPSAPYLGERLERGGLGRVPGATGEGRTVRVIKSSVRY